MNAPFRTPAWLIAQPIAHRGLHDRGAGRIENSLTAARAAIAGGFAIECDIQRSSDDEAMVFHDDALGRLTESSGPVGGQTTAALERLSLRGSTDHIPTLPAFLAAVADRVPVVCEIKSLFDGDLRLAERALAIAAGYPGRLAFKSFDPAIVLHLRQRLGPETRHPLGLVTEGTYDDPEWHALDPERKRRLASLADAPAIRPDFLSFSVNDLPHAAATLFRPAFAGPVMTWTVRTPEQRRVAERWADQMVFEGFTP